MRTSYAWVKDDEGLESELKVICVLCLGFGVECLVFGVWFTARGLWNSDTRQAG
jgi:hypothetical protein